MSSIGNLVGYQVVWFVAVYTAGHGSPWPAVGATAVFAAWQLSLSTQRRLDVQLVGAALVIGMLLDGALARGAVLHYAAPDPALPPRGAPVWILSLWVAFALTLNHSLRYVRSRPLLAALLGAVGGPLAYAAAGRLSGAVVLASPPWGTLAYLGVGWGASLLLLAYLANTWERAQGMTPAARQRRAS